MLEVKFTNLMLVSGHGQLLDIELVQDVSLQLSDIIEALLIFVDDDQFRKWVLHRHRLTVTNNATQLDNTLHPGKQISSVVNFVEG